MVNPLSIASAKNIIDDRPVITKDLAVDQDCDTLFSEDYAHLRKFYIDPWPIFERCNLEHFERRFWIEKEIDDFLQNFTRGYFILEAEAGIGKTAFVADLVRQRGLVHHFAELAPGQSGIASGILNLIAQLARLYLPIAETEAVINEVSEQFAAYREACLRESDISDAAIYGNVFLNALRKVTTQYPNQKIIVVIDALDAAGMPKNQNVLGLPRILPEQVFMIVTHRPAAITLNIDPRTPHRKLKLKAADPRNLADMRRYLQNAVNRPPLSAILVDNHCDKDWFVEAIIEKCAGVWVYAQYILCEIEQHRRAPADLTSLPYGIPQYYAAYWKQWRMEKGWYDIYLPVLGMLAAARREISLDDLHALTGVCIRKDELRRLLSEQWGDFVATVTGPRYRFSHPTLYDFCEGRVREEDLSPEEQTLIEELKLSTIKHALHIIHGIEDIEICRDAALTLAKLDWFTHLSKIPLQKPHIGMPVDLHMRIETTLSSTDFFSGDAMLRVIFADSRLIQWRDRLPEAHSPAERVQITIDFLRNLFNTDRQNALALFLYVLADRISPADACHHRLIELAKEWEHIVTWDEINTQAENVLKYLELVERFLTTPAERAYTVEIISSVLGAQPLPARYKIQLYVHRAINYGYLQELNEAASDYYQALLLFEEGGERSEPSAMLTAARIFLGAANISRERGNAIDETKDQEGRAESLRRAQNFYSKAIEWATKYAADLILIVVIYTELSWCNALLRDWEAAVLSYHKALETLERVKDVQIQKSYRAFILETMSNIFWEQGQYALATQQDTEQAGRAYQKAYDCAVEEINMLRDMLGELNALTIAHINAGDFLLAKSELPGCPDSQEVARNAREHWLQAIALAQAWGLYNLEEEARKRLGTSGG